MSSAESTVTTEVRSVFCFLGVNCRVRHSICGCTLVLALRSANQFLTKRAGYITAATMLVCLYMCLPNHPPQHAQVQGTKKIRAICKEFDAGAAQGWLRIQFKRKYTNSASVPTDHAHSAEATHSCCCRVSVCF